MGLLECQAMPSLRDVAHDGVCVHLVIDQPREKTYTIYIEHRAGKAARLASWRKMTQPGVFGW
jgi:hypothetical protein